MSSKESQKLIDARAYLRRASDWISTNGNRAENLRKDVRSLLMKLHEPSMFDEQVGHLLAILYKQDNRNHTASEYATMLQQVAEHPLGNN